MLTRRKAQLYLVELVIAVILIASVILVLQTLQIAPNQARIQRKMELREIGWNALATSDEIGLLRPAVYSKWVQDISPEIRALEDFLSLILVPELDYILDAKSQIAENTWNLIGGKKIGERGENEEIVVVVYLILGNPHSPSNQNILDPVAVILSLWYAK